MKTAPGKVDFPTMVGANDLKKAQIQHGSREDPVSDKGESAPTEVVACLLSPRAEKQEERVVEPTHRQWQPSPEQVGTTAAAPSAAACGMVKIVASRALCAINAATEANREPVKMPGSGPSAAALGNQRKLVARRAAIGEACSGDKENRLGAAGSILRLL